MGRLEEAIQDFTRAIDLEATASSYNSRGLARDRALLRESALEDFTTAISLESDNPLFWHNRGFCYRNMGKFSDAIKDYSRAIDLEKGKGDGSAAAFNNRGYAWRKLGKYTEAALDYTRSLELDPSNVKAYNNRGYCHAKAGKYMEAIGDYSKVIALEPTNSHAYHNRGISYDKVAMYQEAIQDFTKVLELDSGNANAYFNRASTFVSWEGGFAFWRAQHVFFSFLPLFSSLISYPHPLLLPPFFF
jgi:tetratricopeptide (TPR) repeat protein